MAIHRFIPIQDTLLVNSPSGSYSDMGQSEIVKLGYSELAKTTGSTRILTQFNIEDVSALDLPATYSAHIHYTVSEAHNLSTSYMVEACNLMQDWEEGIHRYGDTEQNTGATWTHRTQNVIWWTPGGSFVTGGMVTQSFTKFDKNDLDIDCTSQVPGWITGSSVYYGTLIKLEDENEAYAYQSSLSFYSSKTHTIYRPYLEIIWDDHTYTGSLPVANPDNVRVTSNIKDKYVYGDNIEIRLTVGPEHPARIYTTGSLYRNCEVLPEGSCWGVLDNLTGERIVDFSVGTKLNADSEGNYFNLDTSMLEPERYYRLQYKVSGGQTILEDNVFKIVRDGQYQEY